MIIPGIVISILTFPGVIVHELGHKYFCDRFGVKVHDVKYFRFGNPAGYVLHDTPNKFYQTFFIDVGPFLMNTVVAIAIFFLVALLHAESGPLLFVSGLFSWLGISIGMHSFPSSHDAKVLWKESTRHISRGDPIAVVGFPFSILIRMANILSFIWFDLIYALALLYAVAWIVNPIL